LPVECEHELRVRILAQRLVACHWANPARLDGDGLLATLKRVLYLPLLTYTWRAEQLRRRVRESGRLLVVHVPFRKLMCRGEYICLAVASAHIQPTPRLGQEAAP
jgi:hypothetical protein